MQQSGILSDNINSFQYQSFINMLGVFFWGGKGGGGTPLRHGHKESHKDLKFEKFDLRSGTRTHDLMNTSLML